jgi:thiamine biosynthesis lipoprotein
MRRCKPLLGTFVEISIAQEDAEASMNDAFTEIEKVQDLMSFHHPQSELSKINRQAHLSPIKIDRWTAQILQIAQDIHAHSGGLFNCGVGHRLITAGLLPNHLNINEHDFGGIEDLYFIDQETIRSVRPLCLDLGGIAKGFAVDMAVNTLIARGVDLGAVNAGGDLRVFGNICQTIYLRNPQAPSQLFEIGTLSNGAIATSGLYFAARDKVKSHIVHPFKNTEFDIEESLLESYSILAKECVYADALTKVLALSRQQNHPCFAHYSAQAIRIRR